VPAQTVLSVSVDYQAPFSYNSSRFYTVGYVLYCRCLTGGAMSALSWRRMFTRRGSVSLIAF